MIEREDNEPHIKWKHVDGPVLVCRDGTMHWLTIQERIWLKFGFTTIELLDKQYNDCDARGW